MDEPSEYSESGAPIYRHESREKPFEPSHGDADQIERISEHIEKYLGDPGMVFHELVSDLVHIDVHQVPPRPDRNFYTLITSGMSERPMTTPEEAAEFQFAELLLCLPPDWKLTQEAFEDERNYWPIRLLKTLARLPHEYDTWLSFGHTIPNGDPAEPYASDTKLCCALLAPPCLADEQFFKLQLSAEKTIYFWAVVPLYQEEVDFKLKEGADPLFERFDQHSVTELLDVKRKNVVKKRFGLF